MGCYNGGVMTTARGEAALRRENGGDDVSWADADLTDPKNKQNPHGTFSWYKWMVKI
jgi:hypothetical protein